MNLWRNILQYFEDPTIPIGSKIYKSNTLEFQNDLKYDYSTIEKLLEDERVYSIVVLVASMVQKAYQGPELYPENRYTDNVLSSSEEIVILEAENIARKLNFKQLCFDYAWDLITHGDLFEEIIKDGEGVQELLSLPLNAVRAFESKDQQRQSGSGIQITKEVFINVSKGDNDTAPRVIESDDYLHLSFKNHAVWRKDIKQVDTYGIYSKPPIASLQRLVDWKKKTIENDMIWKNKLLPRVLYKLKMPSIVPSKYTGTPEEKIIKARQDAHRLTNEFAQSVKTLRPDDDITISDAVEASMLEASSANYQRPNETIGQINGLLNTPQGIANGLLGADGDTGLASELNAIFAGIRVEYLINKIAAGLTVIMKHNARINSSAGGEEVIDRLFIHFDSALTVEKFEKMKTALSMANTGVFTKAEVRKAAGFVRLPQLTDELFPDQRIFGAIKTPGNLIGDIKTEKTQNMENNTSRNAIRDSTENTTKFET